MLINLAYVTHHKHAHSSATDREIEREKGGGREGGGGAKGQNGAPKSTVLKNK